MWNKRQRGTTLVELIIAMVIIGVAVAGVLQVFNVTTIASADPIVQKQLRVVAEGMMDEIQRQPFAASTNTASVGCARNTFNDVMDYNGYSPGMICLVTGDQVMELAGMTISVTVAADTNNTLGLGTSDAYVITVKTARGNNSFTLTGWRANYAKGVAI
ncbi:prepilin-type N-terminal cleavage/methylation domain-containing protein [Duganella sp. FT92W]|uniref:Prepilin-type N-terminal cleavage/methylation domain-containing protein n=1 Tax=Pseudoduganella rivuli TaxID=2666085 RepID=A0A7X2IKF4_9BURK|nr:prepilin-type N-terminal cleavage/methylation domain-containing protein [Pseudoduganella rivuli]MRV71485.1 prepilin-type N-terminal cleavage/methylation domain-containing protein [Pseudoduganella rivuli]